MLDDVALYGSHAARIAELRKDVHRAAEARETARLAWVPLEGDAHRLAGQALAAGVGSPELAERAAAARTAADEAFAAVEAAGERGVHARRALDEARRTAWVEASAAADQAAEPRRTARRMERARIEAAQERAHSGGVVMKAAKATFSRRFARR